MSTQAKLGDSLLKNLMSQRQQKGELSLEDVGSILQQVASDFNPGGSEVDVFLRDEITRMAEYIDQAKKELAEMMKDDASGTTHKVNVSEQLDAVVKVTEHASTQIMNVADAIQAAAAGIGGEKEQQLMDAATKLYEACSFQDVTGQRIRRAIQHLQQVETMLERFLPGETPSVEVAHKLVVPTQMTTVVAAKSSTDLAQADIDALLN
jgi:chemotaxis protein CheZ